MAMVNMNNLLNGKDSRWLQLEVCREFQRNKCSRPDTECKFAHPPANVEVQNGRVTACYDSIKGRCNREKPPCKYFHPPQHLKDQLLINGRNHLALKNALIQQMGLTPGQAIVPGQVPTVAANPYLTGMPQVGNTYSPYYAPGPIMPAIMGPDPTGVASPLSVVSQTVVQQKMPRSDRLEVCREFQRGACKRAESECRFAHPADSVTANEDGTVTVCMDAVKGRCNRDPCRYFHPPLHLQAQIKAAQSRASAPAAVSPLLAPQTAAALEIGKKRPREPSTADTDLLLMDVKSVGSFYYDNFAFPGMMPYKRPAADKSGVPVYQPNATTYQQLMQLQQPFVPVSCEYTANQTHAPPASSASSSPPAAVATSAADSQVALMVAATQQPPKCDTEVHASGTHTVAATATVPSLVAPDPAAIAKEVAQQNYAKAVKLAQSGTAAAAAAAAANIGALNPLSYTGVALNKQAVLNMNMQGAAAAAAAGMHRFQMPLTATAAGNSALGLGLQHPYAAAMSQASLMNFAAAGRPPTALMNPYAAAAYMRPAYPATAVTSANQFLATGLLGPAQYATMSMDSATYTNAAAAQNSIATAAAAQNNNNNVVMPPYKKLKTT
ncbi:muscleblind-like protein 2a isoform X2 [Atheta coriaria]|uniref:muscleblind-like protein 2a isoform X2 n=1 Tax=Dalotia coriaria TaxID=877792 RepID=UPI0031F46198